MAVLSKDEFFSRLCEVVGDDASENSVKLVEDFTDTYNALEAKADTSETEELRQKLEETNKTWAKRYQDRFFSVPVPGAAGAPPTVPEQQAERAESIQVADLFQTA